MNSLISILRAAKSLVSASNESKKLSALKRNSEPGITNSPVFITNVINLNLITINNISKESSKHGSNDREN